MKNRFTDRVAIVTGGASGIGRAVTDQLLKEGATVYVFDLNVTSVEGIAGIVPVQVDVSDVAALRLAVQGIERVDHLVNAAGVIRSRPIENITEADWDFVFGVNARGLFFLTQICAEKLSPGVGSVVNVSSVGAISGFSTDAADYHASKTAVLSITRSWARVLAKKSVRVNAILPGLTDTPLLRGAYEQKVDPSQAALEEGAEVLLDEELAGIPLAKRAQPAEIARSILFLLSEDSSYMTGASINVSGGVVMV